MGMFSRFSGDSKGAAFGKRIFPLMLALLVCLIWASAAHAQEAPFNSQYDPPPTTPPECTYDPGDSADPGDPSASGEAGDPAAGCAEAPPAPSEGPIVVLPTTGGFLLAPIFLGLAVVAGTGAAVARKKLR